VRSGHWRSGRETDGNGRYFSAGKVDMAERT
jgi:hypothetical protein